MMEEKIKEILNAKTLTDFENKMREVFPNGVDINEIDAKIKQKLESLYSKDYSIEKPIQLRKK